METIDRHTRTRVYGPEEKREEGSFYERKKGSAGYAPINMTALRQAERYYKGKSFSFDQVVDLRHAAFNSRLRKVKIIEMTNYGEDSRPIVLYELVGSCGLHVIPGALDLKQQLRWIHKTLCEYMRPPNSCTLDAHYEIPPEGLWTLWKRNIPLTLRRKLHPDDSEATQSLPLETTCGRQDLALLIRKMRWTTLGYQYDWSTKEYNFDNPPAIFPADLASWCEELSCLAGFGSFKAEAGIVNFYQPGDSLTSHVDRSEKNMTVPLVSISLGASCIFLLGGKGRDDPVTSLKLDSGDVVIMSGESRSYFHGVPRILESLTIDQTLLARNDINQDILDALEILGDGRININVRQVQ